MNKDGKSRQAWIKPEVRRLGHLKDVAGKETAGPQGTNTKS